jgi:hypothetical protein
MGAEAEVREVVRFTNRRTEFWKGDVSNAVAQVCQRVKILAPVRALSEPFTVFQLQLTQLRRLVRVRIARALVSGEKHVDGFTECLGDLELQLGIGAAWGACRAVFRLLSVDKPDQADDDVAGVDLLPQDGHHCLVVGLKVVLQDRVHAPVQ